jgi:hypothetical protein
MSYPSSIYVWIFGVVIIFLLVDIGIIIEDIRSLLKERLPKP